MLLTPEQCAATCKINTKLISKNSIYKAEGEDLVGTRTFSIGFEFESDCYFDKLKLIHVDSIHKTGFPVLIRKTNTHKLSVLDLCEMYDWLVFDLINKEPFYRYKFDEVWREDGKYELAIMLIVYDIPYHEKHIHSSSFMFDLELLDGNEIVSSFKNVHVNILY